MPDSANFLGIKLLITMGFYLWISWERCLLVRGCGGISQIAKITKAGYSGYPVAKQNLKQRIRRNQRL